MVPRDLDVDRSCILEHHAPAIRNASAKSVAETVKLYPHLAKLALAEISTRYQYLVRHLATQFRLLHSYS
jgi:hypothetical protein